MVKFNESDNNQQTEASKQSEVENRKWVKILKAAFMCNPNLEAPNMNKWSHRKALLYEIEFREVIKRIHKVFGTV
jgi:ActR/RegA family two-component response regulator